VPQDGAPLHTVRNTIAYLWRENVAFIELDMCPQESIPGGLDTTFKALLERVYHVRQEVRHRVDQLKQAIGLKWCALPRVDKRGALYDAFNSSMLQAKMKVGLV